MGLIKVVLHSVLHLFSKLVTFSVFFLQSMVDVFLKDVTLYCLEQNLLEA